MKRSGPRCWSRTATALALVLGGCATTGAIAGREAAPPGAVQAVRTDPGILVLAPDRGFLGNEEVRDAYETLARRQNAALVFVTDERTREQLRGALGTLRERGARRIVALPFFVTASHPRWTLAVRLLGEAGVTEVARPFGASYLAVEILSDHLRGITVPAGRRLVVVGYGAPDEPTRERMTSELRQVATTAASGFGFADVRAVVWHEGPEPREDLAEASRAALGGALAGGERPVVVPFDVGKKLDGMMTSTAMLRSELPAGVDLLDVDVTPHPEVALWMVREAGRHTPFAPEELGVVLLAHGSDFHWNETMREAIGQLASRYKVEFAFCMADQPVVERAVRRLEVRGARAIVVVRVFGLTSSFQPEVERMLGLDVEPGRVASSGHGGHAAHGAGHGHGHGAHGHGAASAAPPPRIRSAALTATVGGLEDHALFAEALVARARVLSREPARETVILVAHGAGEDERNEHWVHVLESLASRMRASGGAEFRGIQVATWREDWQGKREPWIAKVRGYVETAGRDGGRALVIPARTNAQGPERELLAGLDFALGEGFAPHPLFARWVESQVAQGTEQLRRSNVAPAPATDEDHHRHHPPAHAGRE